MSKAWVQGVGHSPVCQLLFQIVVRAVITSSWPAWTSSAGMMSTPADFSFFNVYTAESASVSVWGQFTTDESPLALWLYSSEQYSVHRFNMSCSSVRHFPERSWIVVALPCFTVVKYFTSWWALLLLFSPRFSSISLQFSSAFFMHFLMLLFIFMYFSDPSGWNFFFLSYLHLLDRSKNSSLTQGLFFRIFFFFANKKYMQIVNMSINT